ncbi:MAG TPA: glycosyltransferase [Acidobacteriota bacterium]|nr:glycosyltransferase [Acidobacteriota bacterium]
MTEPVTDINASRSDAVSGPCPRIAVVVPILNEAESLGPTLRALKAQDYPNEQLEIVIVDGGSQDGWRAVVVAADDGTIPIRVLDNPKRTTAAGVNLALKSTTADAVLWISGHCVLAPDYIRKIATAFSEQPLQVVGGRLAVRGYGVVGRLNAMLLASRFGTGTAPLRFGEDEGWTRTVTYTVWDREHLLKVGGLDERFHRNQDIDLIVRLKQDGVRFRRVDTEAIYLAPGSFGGIRRRAFWNGAWNIWGQRLRRGGLSWWHFAPMAMVGLGVVLAVGSLWSTGALFALAVLAGIYGVLAVGSAVTIAAQHRAWWGIPVLPFLFFVHHVVYGLGSWFALLRPVPSRPGSAGDHG